ncbi:2OG-Fe(II) oxygenase family protein [Lipingzhangella sp. LS1_29]|uniref:2OG-Fe(II) oxygenase family protein n=1 Tax=Lipingzhangella rawalii TaxID=2055835 RepID=A0ABU2H1C9_9ACTN|nr:2OG-Fe(II) oxygenase family protein [Lipingzhangella rawalii]MDS1269101.1 2OG-Fe(II) oxygenase family protein [Lipingzhangella rawalii]
MDEIGVYTWDRTPANAADMVQSLRDTGYTFVPIAHDPIKDALDTAQRMSTLTDEDLCRFVWEDVDEFGSLGWEKRVLTDGVRRDMLNVTGGLIANDQHWLTDEHRRLRAICVAAHHELHAVLTEVYSAIDVQLCLDSPITQLLDHEVSTLRLLWYVGVEQPDTSPYPTPPHTDLGLVTAVVQDLDGGLEVDIDGTWYRLPVRAGHALVAVGDLLEVITDGDLKSRPHRVPARPRQAPDAGNRVSMVLFAHPAADFELAKTMANPRWTTAGEYLSYRLAHKGEPIS